MSHLQLALRLKPEFPERQEASLGNPELVCWVLIEPEVSGNLVKGIEVYHPLYYFGGNQKLLVNIILRSSSCRLISISVNFTLLFFVRLFLSLTEIIINDGWTYGVRVDGTKISKKLIYWLKTHNFILTLEVGLSDILNLEPQIIWFEWPFL